MKQLTIFALGVLIALGASAQTPLTATPIESNPKVRWFPIYARFAPDGSWVVVNLCSFHNPFYCRLVRWEPNGQPQTLEDGTPTTGRWTLIAGQEPNKSYIWPSVSWSGKKLAYVVADCPVKPPQPLPSRSTDGLPSLPHALEKLDCAFYNGQPAMSESTTDLKQGQQIAPIYSATRPAWRPDDQALLYWRTIGATKLASGRTLGQRDVYEYDFKEQVERPKFDRLATKIMWDNEATGPFYAPDGKTFALCGYGFSFPSRLDVQPSPECISVHSSDPAQIEGVNRKSMSHLFGWILGDWQGKAWITSGDQIRLIDKASMRVLDELMNMRLSNGHYSNQTPNAVDVSKTGSAILVNRTFFRSQPIRRSDYWIADGRDAPPAPLLSYHGSQTREFQPVFWPNVDQLN